MAEGHFPDANVTEQLLLSSSDLHALAGDDLYAQLVTWVADGYTSFDMRATYDGLFPRQCFCRRQGRMDCNELDFSGANAYRRIYFSDPCVSDSCDVMFKRTPDIDLIRCRECGDVWICGRDLDWGRQHLLLLEPDDLARIERGRVWPSGLDAAEATWIAAENGVRHDDPRVPTWQREANTAEAVARFGCASNSMTKHEARKSE